MPNPHMHSMWIGVPLGDSMPGCGGGAAQVNDGFEGYSEMQLL